jgi:hypothetical protein
MRPEKGAKKVNTQGIFDIKLIPPVFVNDDLKAKKDRPHHRGRSFQ